MVNKRKLKRTAKKKQKSPKQIIRNMADKTATAASNGEFTIEYIGNFIFFSTESGEAWMLDHRRNYALRLAEEKKRLSYTINETVERFQVEWKERFRIDGDKFIATRKDNEQVFSNYPIDALSGLIEIIKEKEKHRLKSKPAFKS